MNWTTIVDEDSRARYFENRLNEIVRHCKIGKVTRKGPPKPLKSVQADLWRFKGVSRVQY